MDLNRLYFNHQVLLIRSARTAMSMRCQNKQRAARIAARIAQIQKVLGARAAQDWQRSSEQAA